MKSMNFIIDLVVYPFDFMVSVAQTDAELKKALRKYNITDPTGIERINNEEAKCVNFEGNQTLIRLYKYPKTAFDYGNLQHEIFHGVQFLFFKINLPLTVESGEAYAYLIDYLTTEIYKRLWK